MAFGDGTKRATFIGVALFVLAGPAAAQDSAAHRIADKFAGDAGAQNAEAQRKAEEERKRDTERKAQEALREQARKRADEALKADREREKQRAQATASKKPEPALEKVEAPGPKPPDPKVEESDMLERARLEEEQRRKADEQARAEEAARRKIEEAENARREIEKIIIGGTSGPKPAAPDLADAPHMSVADARRAWRRSADRIAAREKAEADAKVVADARRTWRRSADRIATREKADADAKVVADARRTWRRSADRIAAREKAAAEAKILAQAPIAPPSAPEPSIRAPGMPVPAVSTPPRPEPGEPARVAEGATPESPKVPQSGLESRVTILIVMEPGDRGIRRHNKHADPLLCANEGCYVSAGADTPARFMPGRQALGIGNTWGGRAGACRNQLGCVFRSVRVSEMPLILQPVDMRVVKHDRRRMQAIAADSQCRLEGGRLSCARGIHADDYVMWVLPESLADAAGPAALEQAVRDGLHAPRSAAVKGDRI